MPREWTVPGCDSFDTELPSIRDHSAVASVKAQMWCTRSADHVLGRLSVSARCIPLWEGRRARRGRGRPQGAGQPAVAARRGRRPRPGRRRGGLRHRQGERPGAAGEEGPPDRQPGVTRGRRARMAPSRKGRPRTGGKGRPETGRRTTEPLRAWPAACRFRRLGITHHLIPRVVNHGNHRYSCGKDK